MTGHILPPIGKEGKPVAIRFDLLDLGQDNVRLYHLCNADVGRVETLGVGREVQLAREFAIV